MVVDGFVCNDWFNVDSQRNRDQSKVCWMIEGGAVHSGGGGMFGQSSGGGLFGQPSSGGGLFGQPAQGGMFGGGFGGTATGTTTKMQEITDQETKLKYAHIGVMDCYKNKSFEEPMP
jgi:hypothetical protein